ncbi:MAG TPA: hypothetical protein VHM19_14110, partial [Polyangiales bacterium]|nr:hypothetical protein [Polyangiales bacterium]
GMSVALEGMPKQTRLATQSSGVWRAAEEVPFPQQSTPPQGRPRNEPVPPRETSRPRSESVRQGGSDATRQRTEPEFPSKNSVRRGGKR